MRDATDVFGSLPSLSAARGWMMPDFLDYDHDAVEHGRGGPRAIFHRLPHDGR